MFVSAEVLGKAHGVVRGAEQALCLPSERVDAMVFYPYKRWCVLSIFVSALLCRFLLAMLPL